MAASEVFLCRYFYCKLSSLQTSPLNITNHLILLRSSPSDVFLGKGFLKICSKFIGEHPWQSVISIKLQSTSACVFSCNSAADFRTSFYKNTSGGLLLIIRFRIMSFNDVLKRLLGTNTEMDC